MYFHATSSTVVRDPSKYEVCGSKKLKILHYKLPLSLNHSFFGFRSFTIGECKEAEKKWTGGGWKIRTKYVIKSQ